MIRRTFVMGLAAIAIIAGPVLGQDEDLKKFRAICSTTQVADFAREIGGDRWQVDLSLIHI